MIIEGIIRICSAWFLGIVISCWSKERDKNIYKNTEANFEFNLLTYYGEIVTR